MNAKIQSPGDALHAAVMDAMETLLLEGDLAPDTIQGQVLARLAEALEAYEKVTLPPPFGNAAGVGGMEQRLRSGSPLFTDAERDAARRTSAALGHPSQFAAAGVQGTHEPSSADERMRHDYPILQQFHTKHALGALAAPSCLCCGQQTHPITRPIAVRHMELPAIVICKQCKDAAAGVTGTQGDKP